jgi:hypothetical protein
LSYRGKQTGSHGVSKRSVRSFQASGSKRAQSMAFRLKAPVAKSLDQWVEQPTQFDLLNVGAPKNVRTQLEEIAEELYPSDDKVSFRKMLLDKYGQFASVELLNRGNYQEPLLIGDLPSRDGGFEPPHFVIAYEVKNNPDYHRSVFFDGHEAVLLKNAIDEWTAYKGNELFRKNIVDYQGDKGFVTLIGRPAFYGKRQFEIHDDIYQDRIVFTDDELKVLSSKLDKWVGSKGKQSKESDRKSFVNRLRVIDGISSAVYDYDKVTIELRIPHSKWRNRDVIATRAGYFIDQHGLWNAVPTIRMIEVDDPPKLKCG